MKRQILFTFPIIAMLLLPSCENGGDLAEKNKLLAKYKSEMKDLRTKIKDLEAEIAEADTTGNKIIAKKITVRGIEVKEFKHYIEIQGTASSDENIMVSSEIGGVVTEILVNEGEKVVAGQLLAKTDNRTILASIDELNTALVLARDLFQRQENLWNKQIGSEVQFLQAKNQVESLEKQLATAQTQLQKANVKAPISGTVDQVFVNLGEMAAPGNPVVRVVDMRKVEVVADASEKYIPDIQKGDLALLSFPSIHEEMATKISSVGQVVNTKNRTFRVTAAISNNDGKIKTNMLATIKVVDYAVDSAVIIPTRLIQQSLTGEYVFVADRTKGVAVKKQIKSGETFEGETEITSGLNGSETLIDDGFRDVLNGGPVEIID